MALGTKNRQLQLAAECKAHLRARYADHGALVEEYIAEIEGAREEGDFTRWTRFTDERRDPLETRQRLEAAFEKWLRGV